MEIAAKINFARLEAPEAHAGHANIPDLPPSTQPVWQRPSGQSGEQQLSAQKPVIPTKVEIHGHEPSHFQPERRQSSSYARIHGSRLPWGTPILFSK
jgi:hypothetical protein